VSRGRAAGRAVVFHSIQDDLNLVFGHPPAGTNDFSNRTGDCYHLRGKPAETEHLQQVAGSPSEAVSVVNRPYADRNADEPPGYDPDASIPAAVNSIVAPTAKLHNEAHAFLRKP